MIPGVDLLIEGIDFGESPRWRGGRLWYSDFFQGAVFAVDENGRRDRICDVPGQPSGLGWLPDDRMLIVSMLEHQVLRLEQSGHLVLHADLSSLAIHPNDMVVGTDGTAYVGHFGFDFYGKDPSERDPIIGRLNEDGSAVTGDGYSSATIVGVSPDGTAWTAAEGLDFPNGSVITPERTLIVGESVGQRYVAFPIRADGSLDEGNRRVWAEAPRTAPDGCALDSAGGIWFADALRGRLLRIVEGGAVTDTIKPPIRAWACALGGADGRTLFMMCAPGAGASACEGKAQGAIFTTRVDSPRAGLP
jgi:sugar lactone lactonase YvrE